MPHGKIKEAGQMASLFYFTVKRFSYTKSVPCRAADALCGKMC